MKISQKVLDALNDLLTAELTAADQYFMHSRMLKNWGFDVLYDRISHERDDELEHADKLLQRILFLEGCADVAKRDPLTIGSTVPEMLKNDLAYEVAVAGELKKAIKLCETESDYVTRELLNGLLKDTEEDHAYWLEQQLRLIDRMGLENYLESSARSSSEDS